MKKSSKISILLIILVVVLLGYSSGKKAEEENSTSTKKEKYKICDSNYDISKGIMPKVYLNADSEPTRTEYLPVSVSIVDESGQYSEIDDMNAKFKVRGHSTALAEKKPYNIKFSDKQNVLGMGQSKKWCLIANLFDPTLMRNYIALEFARNMGITYTSNATFVEVYYNNEYKGVYLLAEPVGEGKDKVDINTKNNDYLIQLSPRVDYSDNPTILTNIGIYFSIEEGNTEDLTYITDFLNEFENSMAYGYEKVCKYADMESFVDYYVFSEIFKDVDFATSSAYYYLKDGKLYAGPAWDYDLSMGNVTDVHEEYNNSATSGDSTEGFYCNKLWFMYLCEMPEFNDMVKERYNELLPLIENLTTDNELGKNRIDTVKDNCSEFFDKNFTVWEQGKLYGKYGKQPLATYDENVEYLRQWLISRNEWLKSQWNE